MDLMNRTICLVDEFYSQSWAFGQNLIEIGRAHV